MNKMKELEIMLLLLMIAITLLIGSGVYLGIALLRSL